MEREKSSIRGVIGMLLFPVAGSVHSVIEPPRAWGRHAVPVMVGLLVAALVALLTQSSVQADSIRVRVESRHDATIRNAPAAVGSGYVVGNALTARPGRRGVAFDMAGPNVRGYRYGRIHGNVRFCAWLIVESVQTIGPVRTARCPGGSAGRALSVRKFMYLLPNGKPLRNCEPGDCGDGSKAAVRPARCAQQHPRGVPVYGNVLPWKPTAVPHDRYATITAPSYEVLWRYVTRDGNWVMVRDTHADNSAARRNAGFRSQWAFYLVNSI